MYGLKYMLQHKMQVKLFVQMWVTIIPCAIVYCITIQVKRFCCVDRPVCTESMERLKHVPVHVEGLPRL
jgi:hypothetical protein